jgi:phenol 2-monooxygenase (NADPH)
MVELVVLHPLKQRFEWTDIPSSVKEYAEMTFHGLSDEDFYQVYGVSAESGALVVVRPDGVVGTVASLDESDSVEKYLAGCLISCSV